MRWLDSQRVALFFNNECRRVSVSGFRHPSFAASYSRGTAGFRCCCIDNFYERGGYVSS
jgi:hypothetical protein